MALLLIQLIWSLACFDMEAYMKVLLPLEGQQMFSWAFQFCFAEKTKFLAWTEFKTVKGGLIFLKISKIKSQPFANYSPFMDALLVKSFQVKSLSLYFHSSQKEFLQRISKKETLLSSSHKYCSFILLVRTTDEWF